MNFLSKIAPFLSTALGLAGPWGNLAGQALSAALGVKSAKPDDLTAALAKATPEQIEAVKKAEYDFQIQMKQLDIQSVQDLEKIANDDRASARDREKSVRDFMPKLLGISCFALFAYCVITMLLGLSKADGAMAGALIGYASAKAEQVITYYFGSSAGSDRKTEILANGNGH